MPKYITFKIKKTQKAQLATEFAATNVIQNARHVAVVGYIDGIVLTNEACNGIYKELFRIVQTAGRKLEFFIDQQTADMMRKSARMNWVMNSANVIIHIVGDWKKWSPGELGMKFDAIIANPPYCSGLHLKILQDLMPLSDNIVCIHPASWLQFPTRQRPAFMNGRIGDFQIIDRKEANEMFDIDEGDLVISSFVKNGKEFNGLPEDDKNFCCFDYNSMFMGYGRIVRSIWNKVIGKMRLDTLKNAFADPKQLSAYPLRIMITRDSTKAAGRNNHNGGSGGTGFRIVSKNKTTAYKTHLAGGIHFLNFNTDVERYNAWQSYLTKFARFCICMDESTKLAPYMGNYTQPWDDQRFYAYFGLTQPEIQLIETVIK